MMKMRSLSRAYTSQSQSLFPLKHVTKSNLESSLRDLKSQIKAADFVAIDMEMSGVSSCPWRDSFDFDSSLVRYLKLKDSAHKFVAFQFGVCPFRWDPLSLSFLSHPHNFFVFPREDEFLCQTSSLEFLANHQFDFNACIREGVSYLSKKQEEDRRRQLVLKREKEDREACNCKPNDGNTPVVNITDVLFSARMKDKLTQWRDGLLSNGVGNEGLTTVFHRGRPGISLSNFSRHQIRMIQLVVEKHFKDLVFVHVDREESSSERFVVYTESEADKDLLLKEEKEERNRQEEKKINAAIGFRHVIDMLSSSKKLIVGHNCFLDIAHIYSQFLGPLPPTVEEFVSSINTYFPYIVDTKILLNSSTVLQQRMKNSSTTLSAAFMSLCPHMASGSHNNSSLGTTSFVKVEVEVDDARSSNWNSGVKHEAGYDAFMTGCVFAQACNHLGINFQSHLQSDNFADNERLQKHMNRLYLSWIGGDIIDLRTGERIGESLFSKNLKKAYPKIVFDNVVLIWRLPRMLKAAEVRQSITKVFGLTSVKSVYRIDETAVLVQFSNADLVSKFLILKESLENSHETVSVLHPLGRLLEGGNTCAAGYETYKEICSSPSSKLLFADQAKAVGIRWKTKLVAPVVKVEEAHLASVEEINADGSGSPYYRSASTEIVDSFCSVPVESRISAAS